MEKKSESNLILGFWSVQGLGQIPRYLLEYLEVPYTEKVYDPKNPKEWFEDKEKLGLDFPNLPYLIDGETKITESHAISRYIVYKSGQVDMLGKDMYDQSMICTIVALVREIGHLLVLVCTCPKEKREFVKKNIYKQIEPKLKEISKFLGAKQWLLIYMSIADFILAQVMDYLFSFDNLILQKYENILNHHHRFFELKKIKEYVSSERYFKKYLLPGSTWDGPE